MPIKRPRHKNKIKHHIAQLHNNWVSVMVRIESKSINKHPHTHIIGVGQRVQGGSHCKDNRHQQPTTQKVAPTLIVSTKITESSIIIQAEKKQSI